MEHPEPDVGDARRDVERQLDPAAVPGRVAASSPRGRPGGTGGRRAGSCWAATVAAGDEGTGRGPDRDPEHGAAHHVHGPVDAHVDARHADRDGEHPRDPPQPWREQRVEDGGERRRPWWCAPTGTRTRRPRRGRSRHQGAPVPGGDARSAPSAHRRAATPRAPPTAIATTGTGSAGERGGPDARRSARSRPPTCRAASPPRGGHRPSGANRSPPRRRRPRPARSAGRTPAPRSRPAARAPRPRRWRRRCSRRRTGPPAGVLGPVGDDAVERQRGQAHLGGQVLEPAVDLQAQIVHPGDEDLVDGVLVGGDGGGAEVDRVAEEPVDVPRCERVAQQGHLGSVVGRRAPRSAAPPARTAPTAGTGRACPAAAAPRPPRRPRRGPSCRWRSPSHRAARRRPPRRSGPARRCGAAWRVAAPWRSPTRSATDASVVRRSNPSWSITGTPSRGEADVDLDVVGAELGRAPDAFEAVLGSVERARCGGR